MSAGLNQFTDLRLFDNIGNHRHQFYADYRPFNMVSGSYPELPRINAGLKVLLGV